MFLDKLKEYAEERMQDQLPPLYEQTPVAYIVVINTEGHPVSPTPISRIDASTTRGKRGLDMAAPVVQRSYGVKPLLLADSGEYTFGRPREAAKHDRAHRAHAAYRDMLNRCASSTAEPAVQAVQRFYEIGGADQLDLDESWDYGLKVTFEVHLQDGTRQRPIELPTVQAFWLSENGPNRESADQCLVCGELRPVLDRLQAKIKGIRGGQTAGTSLISANSEAFESYGLQASRIAPTCRECGEAFTRGANDLLAGERTHFATGNTTFIFWTKEQGGGFDLGSFMQDPDPAEIKSLLASVHRGRLAGIVDETAFYAAALSGSGGRAVVRDWIDTTVGNVRETVARWFQLQKIIDPRDEDPAGANPRFLSLFRLAVSTVRTANDLPVTTPRALFRAAIQGAPLPMDIAFQVVRRNRAEQGVRRERAALIKLVLLSWQGHKLTGNETPMEEDYMVSLEPQHPSTAYHCGRLLAVIEEIQRAALPGVNATIVDRFYGAASSTPAVVFGALLRGAQPHLARLERDNRGAYFNLQQRLEDVCAQIGDWPATLPLKEQALFSLGYYHQRAQGRAEALARREARIPTGNDESEREG